MKEVQELTRPLIEKQEVEKEEDRRNMASSNTAGFEELYKVRASNMHDSRSLMMTLGFVNMRLKMMLMKFIIFFIGWSSAGKGRFWYCLRRHSDKSKHIFSFQILILFFPGRTESCHQACCQGQDKGVGPGRRPHRGLGVHGLQCGMGCNWMQSRETKQYH